MSTTLWTDSKVADLKLMWANDVPNQQIADRLGFSSGGTISVKAKELGLAPRGAARPATIAAMPVLASAASDGLLGLRAGDCRWPNGNPQNDDFRFCGAQAEPGRPYCTAHCDRAYLDEVMPASKLARGLRKYL